MTQVSASPPSRADVFLTAALPAGLVGNTIIGDLHQEFAEIKARRGTLIARAWYWLQGPSADLPSVGSTVQAVVDGVVCDETVMEAAPFFGTAGFPRLIVLSEALEPGCGRPGATVAFLVGGAEVGSIPWQAGLQRLELAAPVPVQGPVAGSGPQAQSWGVATALVAILFATGLLLAGGSRLLARRR